MERDPITAQRGAELVTVLPEHGWRVVSRTREMLAWWADEVWTLESVWTPMGVQIFLTFLVDPMADNTVWALAASDRMMANHLAAPFGCTIPLRHVWARRLPAWLDALDKLRTLPAPTEEDAI